MRRQSFSCLGIVLVWLSLPATACAGWREAAPLPEPRWFHRAGLGSDGRIYAFGGYVHPEGHPIREYGLSEWAMVAYDPEANSWSRCPEPPPFRYTLRDVNKRFTFEGEPYLDPWESKVEAEVSHSMPSGGEGGKGKIYWFTFPGPVVFNPKERKWEQPEGQIYRQDQGRYEGSVPEYSRTNAAIATGPKGRIYFLGGRGRATSESGTGETQLLAAVEVYDPETNTWSKVAPMQRARQVFAASFGPQGRLYVFGGFGHKGGISQRDGESDASFARRGAEMRALDQALDSVEMWDPETNTWSYQAPMPMAVQGGDAALGADDRIYVVGGTRRFSHPEPTDRVQVYDPRTDSWSEGPSLNEARQGHALVTTPDGKIYAIGGTSRHSGFHPRQFLGGRGRKKGERFDSMEVLDTAPAESPPEPQPAPPDRG